MRMRLSVLDPLPRLDAAGIGMPDGADLADIIRKRQKLLCRIASGQDKLRLAVCDDLLSKGTSMRSWL